MKTGGDQARSFKQKGEPRLPSEVPLSEGRRRDVRPLRVPSEILPAPTRSGEPYKASAEEKQASGFRHRPLY